MFSLVYKATRKIYGTFLKFLEKIVTLVVLKGNKVIFSSVNSVGVPYVVVAKGGSLSLGVNFSMNNGIKGNPIGCYQKCTFFVDRGAVMKIGSNVGISQAALICHTQITIGDNVKIGGGVKVFDTDFHSLDPVIRASKDDFKYKEKAPVEIKSNAFIGADSIILKGVTIGCNSIVGAGSLVAKSIPDNQIWAGNPAKFIKNIE
ncbi:acyltransferase [Neptunitalea lumnitzerae]|uniref:Acyltransferase n=1 Tax=Neptunitalea lumnitzerae TaxID=2965509 RepID=A0ABQ5MGW5_9FLAO|nr:acyltransferase [Neptunitalea sp. Y10]GLB48661.1 hypothetical protein Y10_10290 [Neptunitalea sp. Y10]